MKIDDLGSDSFDDYNLQFFTFIISKIVFLNILYYQLFVPAAMRQLAKLLL